MKRLLFVLISAMLLAGCRAKGLPAEEWLSEKYGSLDQIEQFCADMDDTVTLYVISAIDAGQYLAGLDSLEESLSAIIEDEGADGIRPGTHTYETKMGQDAYGRILDDLSQLLTALRDSQVLENKDALSYLYLGYQEAVSADIEEFASYVP